MGKVLDITGRLGKVQPIQGRKAKVPESVISDGTAPLTLPIDMTARRDAVITEDRRQVKRTFLTEFISVHAVVPGLGLVRVALDNINPVGLAFDFEIARGSFKAGEEVAMRVYMNHFTYFPFTVIIKHMNTIAAEGVVRHGCEFALDTINNVALQHFVGFLENVSAGLRQDKGDVLVSNINS
jgi:hypothetical protein